MNLAVIPARGGSKRIPRKNVKTFCGRPIIAWSIEAAKASDDEARAQRSADEAMRSRLEEIFLQLVTRWDTRSLDAELRRAFREYGIEVPVLRCPAHPGRLVRISAQLYNRRADYERLAMALAALL